jgi:hypothetical protein
LRQMEEDVLEQVLRPGNGVQSCLSSAERAVTGLHSPGSSHGWPPGTFNARCYWSIVSRTR